jgi:ribosome-associated heat shock protein Hsp15
MDGVRIDKWLWCVRLYKSRTLATEACEAGKVKISGHPAKPARGVKIGEIITAATGNVTRTVKVLQLLEQRVGAAKVAGFMEDLTPAEEFTKARETSAHVSGFRPKGAGRPTKRDRRVLQSFFE